MAEAILSNLHDDALYALLSQDNKEAFRLLYERYWKRLLYKALLKLPSEADAAEIVQDIFVDLWNSRHRIEIKNSFHTYVAAMARYKIIAKRAALKKQHHQGLDQVEETAYLLDNSTEEGLHFNDLRDEIEAAVGTLPEKCQIIFRMSREEGMSHKEISEKLALSQKSVEAHITRAIKALRKMIRPFHSLTDLSFLFKNLIYRI